MGASPMPMPTEATEATEVTEATEATEAARAPHVTLERLYIKSG